MSKIETLNEFESSNIKQLKYVFDKEDLIVYFKSGSVYCYKEVDENTWNKFKNAESKGSFLSEKIKPKYEYELTKEY